jgi:hypothetical protein
MPARPGVSMNCEDVLNEMSGFVDEVLDARQTALISQHIHDCEECRKEYDRLELLRKKLGALERPNAPESLWYAVRLRTIAAPQEPLMNRLRNDFDLLLARVRNTEAIWYWTRILGTALTSFFFVGITSALNPSYLNYSEGIQGKAASLQTIRQQLPASVLRNLGIISTDAMRRPIQSSDAKINDLYLLHFGQSIAREGNDDSLSVVAIIDRSGSAKIGNVLEYPRDPNLLSHLNDMISSARCRPASQNGRAVEARMVLTFNKISVYD